MRKTHGSNHTPLLALLFAVIAGHSGLQAQSWGVEPFVQVGAFAPGEGIDQSEPDGNWVRLSRALVVGLGAEVRTPKAWLGLRTAVSRTAGGELEESVLLGASSCGPQCFTLIYDDRPLDVGASLLVASVGAVARAPDLLGPVAPYVVGGPSLKRIGVALPGVSSVAGALDPGATYHLGWHGSVGLEVPVRRVVLSIEAIGHTDRRDHDGATTTDGLSGPYAPSAWHTDFLLSTGARLRVR